MKPSALFFGTPSFALPSLEAALQSTNVLAVVTQPDRPRGRGQKVLPCEVKALALEKKLPTFSPASLRKDSAELNELRQFVKAHRPDLLIVTAYGNLLTQGWLDLPRLGAVNVHASLLPRWRGAAPIQRSLEAGDKKTGVSLQKIVLELDAGEVLAEAETALHTETAADELSLELSKMGGDLLVKFLSSWDGVALKGQPQDPSKVTLAAKIKKEESLWDPSWTSTQTHNRVRAFKLWPGVRMATENFSFKVIKTKLAASSLIPPPGTLEIHDQSVLVGGLIRTGERDEALELLTIQVPNKGPVSALSFFKSVFSAPRQGPIKLLKAEWP